MSTTVVNPEPAAQPAAPAAPTAPAAQPAAPPAPEAVSKQEFETLKAQMADQQRALQFWYDKANGKPAEADKPKPTAEDDPDLLDIITTRGSKGFEEYMKKRGFVSREEVEQQVNSKAAQLSKENELMERYPDLRRKDSEFFDATAKHYGELVKSGVPPTMAMELAAERTELQGIHSGKVKTRVQQDAEKKAAEAEERKARARAQAGERGGRPGEADEDDEELTEEQKHIIQRMGISEEAYKKRAKEGVRMSIRGGR